MSKHAIVFAVLALVGCMPPASPSQLLADSAYDMNTAARFGRMDVAADFVSAETRDDFTRTHALWGRDVRVVDVELTNLRMRASDQADVAVSVLWQRPDEAQIRTTQLAQRWKDGAGGWRMISEEQSGGDATLLEERRKLKTTKTAAAATGEMERAPRRASFQTRIIQAAE